MPFLPNQLPANVYNDIAAHAQGSRYLDTGEAIYERDDNVTGLASTTQTLTLMGFRAIKSETITRIQVYTGATAAGATPTLVRMGIYQRVVAGPTGVINTWGLVASHANDTTLFAAANTTYTKTLTTTFNKQAGSDYAVGMLIVSPAAFPTFIAPHAIAATGGYATDALLAQPVRFAKVITQADLPTSIPLASVVASATGHFHALLLN